MRRFQDVRIALVAVSLRQVISRVKEIKQRTECYEMPYRRLDRSLVGA
jgi:hypothetical protein